MEVITKGTFDGPANANAMRERLNGRGLHSSTSQHNLSRF